MGLRCGREDALNVLFILFIIETKINLLSDINIELIYYSIMIDLTT
jgi:hypothetical protein